MIETIRQAFKRAYRVIAQHLDHLTKGKLTPNMVTWFGLAMHIPIAWLIVIDQYLWAAVFLAFFGLLDTLDGQLAQVQKRTSYRGMLLDSVTDRVKEVLLYAGIAYSLVASEDGAVLAAVTVGALGCSMLTSYLNAMGDTIMAKNPQAAKAGATEHATNKAFRGGLMPFEIRMTLLIVGLLVDQLAAAVIIIAIGAAYTAVSRLIRVTARLGNA